ncbi:hypothetical protein [Rhizobium sp. L43]|uniref:hypothetical protein n=1 Tax=Rhizobium sp. L43 TaxID=2035452 RepID=UPI000BEAE3EF|nr:hypothetical protein [Rhizobium sp. L43]PDS75466.1 hypothetical protein CO667_26655 [Rhizobium sp. L43]
MSFNLTITHNPLSPLGDQYDVWLLGYKLFGFAVENKSKPQGDYYCFSFSGPGRTELLCPSGWVQVPNGPINAPYLLFPLHSINAAADQIAASMFPEMAQTQIVADATGFSVDVAGKTQLRYLQSNGQYFVMNANMVFMMLHGPSPSEPFTFANEGIDQSAVALFDQDDVMALTPIFLMAWRAFVKSQK